MCIPRLFGHALAGVLLLCASHSVIAQSVEYWLDYYSVPAAELLARNNSIGYDTNGVRMFTTDGGQVAFMAPITLPNWSYITSITLEAVDNSGDVEFGGFVRAKLREYRYNTFLDVVTVETDAAGAPGDVRVSDTAAHLVDNTEFSYGLEVILFNGAGGPGSVGYYKVIIEYYWPEFY